MPTSFEIVWIGARLYTVCERIMTCEMQRVSDCQICRREYGVRGQCKYADGGDRIVAARVAERTPLRHSRAAGPLRR